MGLFDGKQIIIDNTLEITKLCAQAAHKSSQITGRVEIKSMIVTGEDIVPILEVMEAFAQVMPPAGGNAMFLRLAYDQGRAPTLLLIGLLLASAFMFFPHSGQSIRTIVY